MTSLDKYVIERIKSGLFYPMEINGKPVKVTTGFNVNLIATFRPDKKLKQLEFSELKILKPSALEIANEIQEISEGKVKNNIIGQYKYPPEGEEAVPRLRSCSFRCYSRRHGLECGSL